MAWPGLTGSVTGYLQCQQPLVGPVATVVVSQPRPLPPPWHQPGETGGVITGNCTLATTTTSGTCWGPCPPQDVAPSFVPAWEPKQRLQRARPGVGPARPCLDLTDRHQSSPRLAKQPASQPQSSSSQANFAISRGGMLAWPGLRRQPTSCLLQDAPCLLIFCMDCKSCPTRLQPVRTIMDGEPGLVSLSPLPQKW